ncbi:MAG: DUF4252 domain-containing protein [Acidobacteriota bacterium]
MNNIKSICQQIFGIALMLFALSAIPAYGQNAKLNIDNLNYLNDKAVQIVDITLGKELIQMASQFIPGKTPDELKIKELLNTIQGVYVKRFEFENEGVFTDSDVNPIRSQLQNPAWAKIITYINKKKDGNKMNVEVFLMTQGSIIHGLSVLATETKALTVVNLVGPIDLQKLAELEGRFGIPDIGLRQATGQPAQQDEANKKDPNKKP